MQISYEPLRGFKDYTPPESEALSWIIQSFVETVKKFSYREIKTPTIEGFRLFELKSGKEIRESMFVFKDKAGREVALRPEITPSIIRVYLREMKHWSKPIRVYYIGNVFRYDEPQFGRYREFTQAGVEILGAEGLHYDVELIEILEEFYDLIGLKSRRYKVNNIAVFRELAKRSGIDGAELDRFLHYLDKSLYSKAAELLTSKGAHEESRIVEELASIKYPSDKVNAMKEILSRLSKDSELLLKHVLVLEKYLDMVRGIGADVVVEPAFARGIAYYTDIIFEVMVPGFPVSIAGGGRYNDLTQVYGGENLPTTGFAIGVERTMLALASNISELPVSRIARVLFLLLIDEPQVYAKMYSLVRELRKNNIYVQFEVASSTKLSRWLEYASKNSVDYIIIVGKKELESNVASVRDMKKWIQKIVPLNILTKAINSGE
ncbi:MAG: histidine--tRNA ligase [Ignisphaera sp.]|uniref:Histidine--tRNA ligase n=1 Tax=Ignisphaera aggregans TaxID=334771 RepID=A0A7C4NNB1_9CREN